MNAQFLIFLSVFFTVYFTANYYVGLRGWQAFHRWPAFPGGRFYAAVFVLVASGYILERLLGRYLPEDLNCFLAYVGGTWMAILFYAVIFCVIIDLFRLADRVRPFIPAGWRQAPALVGATVVALVSVIIVFGIWNARNTVWRQYDLVIEKSAGDLKGMRVVMVSDIHLGRVVGSQRLEYLVQEINARKPDLVLLAGDVFDEDIGHFIKQDMGSIFRRLNPRFGVFAVLGNHEYIGRETDTAIELMKTGGITVLRDSYLLLENRFVVAGRDDWDRERFLGSQRKPLAEILRGVDPALPLFLMDHQPRRLAEAADAGVDLSLSGHTHRGQLYPNHLITSRLYELDWGYLRKKSMHVIVSAGFGTWGPPVRTSTPSEIVEINLKFRPQSQP
jgi:hypothetical protein